MQTSISASTLNHHNFRVGEDAFARQQHKCNQFQLYHTTEHESYYCSIHYTTPAKHGTALPNRNGKSVGGCRIKLALDRSLTGNRGVVKL